MRTDIKETSKSASLALCEGNSPVTGEFPAQRATSNAEKASIWWRHYSCWTYLNSVVQSMEHSFELDSIVTFAVWRTSTLYGLLMKYMQRFGIDFSSTFSIQNKLNMHYDTLPVYFKVSMRGRINPAICYECKVDTMLRHMFLEDVWEGMYFD